MQTFQWTHIFDINSFGKKLLQIIEEVAHIKYGSIYCNNDYYYNNQH